MKSSFKFQRHQYRSRPPSGSALLEALFCFLIVIPILLLLLDLGILTLASSANHDLCCFAARSASTGSPDAFVKGLPRKRALDAIGATSYPKMLMTIQPNIEVTESVTAMPDADVYGGQVEGLVTVKTLASVRPPFLLLFMVGKKEITVRATQTYPYTAAIESENASQSR